MTATSCEIWFVTDNKNSDAVALRAKIVSAAAKQAAFEIDFKSYLLSFLFFRHKIAREAIHIFHFLDHTTNDFNICIYWISGILSYRSLFIIDDGRGGKNGCTLQNKLGKRYIVREL